MNTDLGLEIIRGDRPLSDVSRLGVTVSRTPLFFEIDAPRRADTVLPTVDDVATGFLAHMSDGDELREWAAVVIGARFIDLIALESDPDGEPIIEGLWDVSSGGPVAPSVMRAIAAVLNRRSHI
ncbi:MAG TPA: hypothetical protein VFC09_15265 [Candidatus Dormibacteraeota bacterium]|nr:hypothetical protein [Candidatus Dormibacteraeota bacterium]